MWCMYYVLLYNVCNVLLYNAFLYYTWEKILIEILFVLHRFCFYMFIFSHFPQISSNYFLHNFQTTGIQILYSYDNKIRDYTCHSDNTWNPWNFQRVSWQPNFWYMSLGTKDYINWIANQPTWQNFSILAKMLSPPMERNVSAGKNDFREIYRD